MYCIQCGTKNGDTAKYCIKCGHPLVQARASGPEVEKAPVPRAKPRDRRKATPGMTLGSKLAAVAATIVIVGFFLPWATASCGGVQGTATGLDVANGIIQTNYGPNEDLPAQPELFLVLGAAGLVLLVSLIFYAMRRVGMWGLAIQVVAAAGGLIVIWDALDTIKHFVAEYVSVTTEPGFIATVGGLIAIIASDVMSLLEIVFHKGRDRYQ